MLYFSIKGMSYHVNIPSGLVEKIKHYLGATNDSRDFEEYLVYQLQIGLNDLILATKKTQKKSYTCNDVNPKVKRLLFDKTLVFEYFVCDSCSKKPLYSEPDIEEEIKWYS